MRTIEIYDTTHATLFPNAEGKTPKDIITKGSDAALIITCGGLLLIYSFVI